MLSKKTLIFSQLILLFLLLASCRPSSSATKVDYYFPKYLDYYERADFKIGTPKLNNEKLAIPIIVNTTIDVVANIKITTDSALVEGSIFNVSKPEKLDGKYYLYYIHLILTSEDFIYNFEIQNIKFDINNYSISLPVKIKVIYENGIINSGEALNFANIDLTFFDGEYLEALYIVNWTGVGGSSSYLINKIEHPNFIIESIQYKSVINLDGGQIPAGEFVNTVNLPFTLDIKEDYIFKFRFKLDKYDSLLYSEMSYVTLGCTDGRTIVITTITLSSFGYDINKPIPSYFLASSFFYEIILRKSEALRESDFR
ncbi:MAG: hypothetical protein LBV55_03450 [Acholeplasmatales bacterium]|jgi:hypothetical protein|nr:hypothetical protein [Acholeplasmatales bacterium]